MSRANTNSNETSTATRCKIDVTHPTSFNSSSSPIRHEPRRHDTNNPITTPLPPPVVVAGQETGETKVEKEESASSISGFGGLFPCAGRPLPGEVLECLFAWLRSSDLSALYSSSSAAAFPGKRGRLKSGRTVHCACSVGCPGLHKRSIHMQARRTYPGMYALGTYVQHNRVNVYVAKKQKTCSSRGSSVQVQIIPGTTRVRSFFQELSVFLFDEFA